MVLKGCLLIAVVALYILGALREGTRLQEMRGLIYFLAFDVAGTVSLIHNGEEALIISFLCAAMASIIAMWVLWSMRQTPQRMEVAEATET